MKYIKPVLLIISFLVFTVTATSQTAEEIVTKYVAAIGGSDNWKKVNSIFYEGKFEVHGTDVAFYKTVLNGKGMRQNMVTSSMTAFQITTPTEGWKYMPFEGQQKPEMVSQDFLKENADQYDAQGVLIDYRQKGHSVEYLGKETIASKEFYKLLIRHKGGKIETLYIDPQTYLLERSIVRQKINGKEEDVVTKFGNYKKLPEGILFPMTITLPFAEMNLVKVEINKPVNENIFKPMN